MNVRRERSPEKQKVNFYDIENFDFTYSFSEIFQRNIDIEYDSKKTYRGGMGYNFTNNPKNIRPFSKVKFLNKYKALKLISDFNFFYAPKLMSFRTDMNREYTERLMRKKSIGDIIIYPTYLKKWDWNRVYDMKFDLTQGLRIDYLANAASYVNEPPGVIDKESGSYQAYKDSVIKELMGFGSMNNYTQSVDVNYNIPINKIPLFSFLTASALYGADYKWTASPKSLQARFGNTIENASNKQLNGSLNMTTLYNKIPFVKKLGFESTNPRGGPKPKGGKPDPKKEVKTPEADSLDQKKEGINWGELMAKGAVRILTSLKNATLTYQLGEGSLIPGFMPSPQYFGNDLNNNTPGWGYIFGVQPNGPQDFQQYLTSDTALNTAFSTKMNENINARATLEPFPDLRIELTATRTKTENHLEYYVADASGNFKPSAPQTTGTFSISYLSWGTAFIGNNSDNTSPVFDKMKEARLEIAQRLAVRNPNWTGNTVDTTGFPDGYGPSSQEVLIPAFLAAYSGKSASSVLLSPFPKIPMPNWRVTYNGLTKIEFFKRYIKNINITHAYRSTYSVGNFTSNLLYQDQDQDGYTTIRNAVNNYVSQYQIQMVTINEQFSPLIDFDVTWVNSLMTKIEFKKSRNLTFSFTNNQLTEVLSNEFVVGLGYRFKDVQFTVKPVGGGKRTNLKSDLNLKADLSIKNNKTTLRRIDEDIDQISAGQRVISINTSAEYMINSKFNVRLFFDKIINKPFISSSFPNSTTNGGITLRFTLAQ